MTVEAQASPSARKQRAQERAGHALDAVASFLPRRNIRCRQPVERIGVLLQWGIGDAVLATPLLRGLRQAYPQAAIELIGKGWLDQLFRGENVHDGAVLLEPPWTRYDRKYSVWRPEWRRYAAQLRRARARHYDLLIAPRFDPREIAQLRLLRADRTAGFRAAGGAAWISHDIGLSRSDHDSRHRSEVAALTAKRLTGHCVASVPKLRADPARQAALRRRFEQAEAGTGLILAVHNGAGNPLRRWGWGPIGDVLRSLPKTVACVVLLDDGDGVPSEALKLPSGVPVLTLRCDLEDAKALLSLCDVLLCSDNGIMHVAAAVGCRVVAVFGPTLPLWFGPAGPGHEVVLLEPMPCRPCSDSCIYARPLCMDGVSRAAVSRALNRVLAGKQVDRAGALSLKIAGLRA